MPRKKNAATEGISSVGNSSSASEHGKTSFERLVILINQASPLVEQVARQIALALAIGALRPDERLPPIEVAAKHARVGTSTMRDVYLLLSRYGISCNTTPGTYFTPTADLAARRFLLSRSASALIHEARSFNLADEEIVGVVLTALTPEKGDS